MRDIVDLAGRWRLALDSHDEGMARGLHAVGLTGDAFIDLPASLPERGIGSPADPITTPWTAHGPINPAQALIANPAERRIAYWLTPRAVHVGPAWYERDIDVPSTWTGRRIVLHLERPHWQTQVYVDGRSVGSCDSLAVPHEHDLTDLLTPGRRHRLTVRVDNRMIVHVGANSHSISDHTQGNWNGLTGALQLRASSPVWIDRVVVAGDIQTRSVRLAVSIGNRSGRVGMGRLRVRSNAQAVEAALAWDALGATLNIDLPLGPSASLWDEFSPGLHPLEIALDDHDGTEIDRRELHVGLRELSRRGRQWLINNKPLFLRGTLECCIFPLTGYPPTGVEPWHRIMRIVKAHGLNHIRFHSYCPPEAAFVAADEAGVYLQVECSSWPNQGATLGEGRPLDQWIFDEARRIVDAFGHHPSFCLMLAGNEPAGAGHEAFLSAWVTYWKRHDPQRLHSTGAGWPVRPESDFHSNHTPRIQRWGEGLKSRINDRAPETHTDYRDHVLDTPGPLLTHEIGQWCAFPNLNEIGSYTGVMRADNLAILRDRLDARRMGHLAADFLQASGKLQALCYKEEIESALRTPELGGFQLLDLHDFPGQGTAPVGVLDAFWNPKGYITPDAYRRFCNSTVPLARLQARTFHVGASIDARLDIAHFGPSPLLGHLISWSLVDDTGRTLRSGSFTPRTIQLGLNSSLASLQIDTADLPAPARYKLVVGIDQTPFQNDWDIWLYPPHLIEPTHTILQTHDPVEAMKALSLGRDVLLTPPADSLRSSASFGFSPIFWNTPWTEGQPPHTLGILCDPSHPALADFPTDSHTNWHWWELIHRRGCLQLQDPDHAPVVRVIDDWNHVRPLAMLVEARLDPGRVMICTADLTTDLPARPVARQLRHSLLRYMSSPAFTPQPMTADAFQSLFHTR